MASVLSHRCDAITVTVVPLSSHGRDAPMANVLSSKWVRRPNGHCNGHCAPPTWWAQYPIVMGYWTSPIPQVRHPLSDITGAMPQQPPWPSCRRDVPMPTWPPFHSTSSVVLQWPPRWTFHGAMATMAPSCLTGAMPNAHHMVHAMMSNAWVRHYSTLSFHVC
jgi:hypothetical protein